MFRNELMGYMRHGLYKDRSAKFLAVFTFKMTENAEMPIWYCDLHIFNFLNVALV